MSHLNFTKNDTKFFFRFFADHKSGGAIEKLFIFIFSLAWRLCTRRESDAMTIRGVDLTLSTDIRSALSHTVCVCLHSVSKFERFDHLFKESCRSALVAAKFIYRLTFELHTWQSEVIGKWKTKHPESQRVEITWIYRRVIYDWVAERVSDRLHNAHA